MSSLLASLSKMVLEDGKATMKKETVEMSLKDLEQVKVTFGKAMKDKTFKQATQDISWVTYMVTRCETSPREDHVKLMTYLKLLVKETEETAGLTTPHDADKETEKKKSSQSPSSQTSSSWGHAEVVGSEQPAPMSPTECELLAQMEDQDFKIHVLDGRLTSMEGRLANMESILQQGVMHLAPPTAGNPATKSKVPN